MPATLHATRKKSAPARVCIRIPEFAELVGISETTTWKLVREGYIRTVRFGPKGVRIPHAELQRLLNEGNGKK